MSFCENMNPCTNQTTGNETNICIDPCQTQVNADIILQQNIPLKICGQVKNQCCQPIANISLTLVKICKNCSGNCWHQEVAQTTSDCNGMYSFEVCSDGKPACYKVFASAKLCQQRC